MKTSDCGISLVKKLEGYSLHAYPDGNSYSIGYGHHTNVNKDDKITKEQALKYLEEDINHVENTINSYVKVPLSQNQYNALISLCYNIGTEAFKGSTLLKKLNQRDYKSASKQFLLWNKVEKKLQYGTVLIESPTLTERRETEMYLFLKGMNN